LKYTPAVKIIKVKCTGRVDVKHILYSIRSGADGVMIVGWRPNECQFKNGNFTAERHVELANRILAFRGFGNQRANMYWVSGGDAGKFVESVEDAYEKLCKAGPNPLKTIEKETLVKSKQVITNPAEWFL